MSGHVDLTPIAYRIGAVGVKLLTLAPPPLPLRWAGKSSDINYYLNSHHIDIHCWACLSFAKPVRVTAMASTGIADHRLQTGANIEDTITLMVQWQNRADGTLGTALYMSSWAAPKADCHTQQYFHYMGHKGEVPALGFTLPVETNSPAHSTADSPQPDRPTPRTMVCVSLPRCGRRRCERISATAGTTGPLTTAGSRHSTRST